MMIGIFVLLPIQLGSRYMDKTQQSYIAEAIKKAENDPKRHGVRSIKVSSPEEASRIVYHSVTNNERRWKKAGSPGKFIDFMQKRWAPIGASNDPENKNKNWAPNVRAILRKKLGEEEYKRYEQLNLVRNRQRTSEVV